MVWGCVFQGGELVGIEQSSWHNGIGLVDTGKQGYWSNSWWANYCFDKWAFHPREQTVCPDKLSCENFLKQWSHLLFLMVIFLGKNFMEQTVKLCWHRWSQF